ncbi:Helicase associated domain protein [Streptomyces sp. NPDC003719]
MVIVSSMDTSGRDDLVAARVMSTTSPHALGRLMSVVGEGQDQIPALTVICTYDSLDKIEATQRTGFEVPAFDLAVMDEAHRIAGRADKKWAVVNDAQRIRAERRLYMTATPRIFAAPELAESADTTRPRRPASQPRPGPDMDAFANSMDNEAVYGKKVFEYPLAQAVADSRAADYRIVVPTLTDADLRRRLNLPTPTTPGDGRGDGSSEDRDGALRTTALHLAVLRAMTEHGLNKVLVYFNLVSHARRFARELPHTLRLLARTDPHLVPDATPALFFAHGEHTPAQRADIFNGFAAADRAVLANSKLIAEGVDIPSVDAIVFADPTRSVIRCAQALGRALRLDVSGKTASLIIPVYIPPGADSEDILGTAYEPVWAIASALAGHDHRILERLPDKANRLPRETSQVIQRRWHFDFTVHPERIARAMDLISLDPRGPSVSRSRRLGLAAAQAYRDEHGHLDVPADHTDPTGYRLGTFITTMRDAAKNGRLEPDWIAELDALGMIWDKHDAAWRSRLTAAADYLRAHGHLAAPATTPRRRLARRTTPPRHQEHPRPRPRRRPHRPRPRLAPPARPGLAPQIPPAARPPRHRRRPRHPHPRHPPGRGEDRLLAPPPAHHLAHPRVRPAADDDRPRPHPRHQPPHPRTPSPPHLRGDRPAPGTLLPPRRPRPHRPRDHPLDGDTVKIGAWLAKARTKHRSGQLPDDHARLVATLFDGDWTTEVAVPAVLA